MRHWIAYLVGVGGLGCIVASDWVYAQEPLRAICGGLCLILVAVLIDTWEGR